MPSKTKHRKSPQDAAKTLNLRSLSFGSPAAEREQQLADLFVVSEAFERLNSGTKSIALGKRGAGKTAIFKMIAAQARERGSVVIELSPDDYSYEYLSRAISTEEGVYLSEGSFATAWKYMIYVLVMKKIVQSKSGLHAGAFAGIYKYLRDNHYLRSLNPVGALISYIKRIEGVQIGHFSAGIKARELEKLYDLEEVHSLLPELRLAANRKPVIVLIDELDKGFDNSKEARAFVAGIFRAARDINGKNIKIKVLLSLRFELYESIPSIYDDAQKIRDQVELIQWTPNALLQLIARRIAVGNGIDPKTPDKKIWTKVFPNSHVSPTRFNSFNFIVDRTLLRPRDLVLFCEAARTEAINRGQTAKVDARSVLAAEARYSEERYRDLISENRFQYADLGRIFGTFRGGQRVMERDEILFHLLRISEGELEIGQAKSWTYGIEPEVLARILWSVGFLRVRPPKASHLKGGHSRKFLGEYQLGSIGLGSVRRFQIHPAFWRYLELQKT